MPAGCCQLMNKRLRDIRHVALDMDGTIYSGGTLFKSTLPFLALMGELGIGHTFLTNNSSKSAKGLPRAPAPDRHRGDAGPALHVHPGDHRASARTNAGGAAVVRARHGQHEPGAGGCRVCADGRQRRATNRMACWLGSTRT